MRAYVCIVNTVVATFGNVAGVNQSFFWKTCIRWFNMVNRKIIPKRSQCSEPVA